VSAGSGLMPRRSGPGQDRRAAVPPPRSPAHHLLAAATDGPASVAAASGRRPSRRPANPDCDQSQLPMVQVTVAVLAGPWSLSGLRLRVGECHSGWQGPGALISETPRMLSHVFTCRVRIHLSLFVTSRLKKNPTEPSPGRVTYRDFLVCGRSIKARRCFPKHKISRFENARHGFSKIMSNSGLFLLSNPVFLLVHARILCSLNCDRLAWHFLQDFACTSAKAFAAQSTR
jgi:hypothetical protein